VLDECVDREIDVRLEKEDYLVIFKPKWVLSHPNSVRDMLHPSVVWWVYHYIRKKTDDSLILPSTGSFIRAGLVHRLDKATSGLMIVAKTERGLAHFKELFQQKSLATTLDAKESVALKKRYKASVEISSDWAEFIDSIKGELPHYIIQDVIPKVPHPTIKKWITKIIWIEEIEHWRATLDIEILTWRTHQIRYHLSQAWLPIVGDYLYGEDAQEMLLEAYQLEFVDTEGKEVKVKQS